MSFTFADSAVAIREEMGDAFRRDWERLARPGTWLWGEERVEAAEVFRSAQAGREVQSTTLSEPAAAAVQLIAGDPASITRDLVADWEHANLDLGVYVELIGIASRLSAIDAFHRAMGLPLEPLPPPRPGPPSEDPPPRGATRGKAFVPMTVGTSIVYALSFVPAESEAQRDLHGPMYLSYEEMGDSEFQRGLHRTQMELIAARTSAINDCFY